MDERDGSDHEIGSRHLDSSLKQCSPNLAEVQRACRVKIENNNVLKQISNKGK
jgi:hypothetical protein